MYLYIYLNIYTNNISIFLQFNALKLRYSFLSKFLFLQKLY